MSDILVIRVNYHVKPSQLTKIRDKIIKQKESGTVILPPYCEVLVVPEDCEIRVEDVAGNEVKGESDD